MGFRCCSFSVEGHEDQQLRSCHTQFLFKQKTAYELRISDWSSDVCSSDLPKNGKITISSPVARALIGKCEGDEVEVRAPTGIRTFELLRIDRKSVVSGKSVSVRVDLGGGRIINKTISLHINPAGLTNPSETASVRKNVYNYI